MELTFLILLLPYFHYLPLLTKGLTQEREFDYEEHLGGRRIRPILRFARSGQFPFSVTINELGGQRICGGVLVGYSNIITTAECALHGLRDNRTYAVAGIHSTSERKVLRRIKLITLHPEYVPGFNVENNIAILTVRKRYKHCRRVKPIDLMEGPLNVSDNFQICGWGTAIKQITADISYKEKINNYPVFGANERKIQASKMKEYKKLFTYSRLKYNSVNIFNQTLCKDLLLLRKNVTIGKHQVICIYGDDDGCLGLSCDTGGPLFNGNKLVGLQIGKIHQSDTFVQYCGDRNMRPSLFVNISHFSGWIKTHLELSGQNSNYQINIYEIIVIILLLICFNN